MAAPNLTNEQIEKFIADFNSIVDKAPNNIKELWEKEGSINVIGKNVIIKPSGFENKLPTQLADKFVSLLNRNGIII